MLDKLNPMLKQIQSFCKTNVDLNDFNQVSTLLTTFCTGWEELLKQIAVNDQSVPSEGDISKLLCSYHANLESVGNNPSDLEKLKTSNTPNLLVKCLLECVLSEESGKSVNPEKKKAAEFVHMYLNHASGNTMEILKNEKTCKLAWIKWNAIGELCRDLQYREMFINGLELSQQSIQAGISIVTTLHQQMGLKQTGGGKRRVKKKGF